ncbi:MAG TPA: DUF4328 domain-containing protein [candidate division Zixibacteria bacterium]|nr:DUF4328 domain-containing protein [candidate division Zixibacteria bacterium]HEQ99389.1 DUF4328 domain-containing protein [candidate division Zixibacteria bacterium]
MALEFTCIRCGNKIIVKYIRKGEIAVCRSCGAKNVVPETAAGVAELDSRLEDLKVFNERPSPTLEDINPSRITPLDFSAKAAIFFVGLSIVLWAANGILDIILIDTLKKLEAVTVIDLANRAVQLEKWGNTIFILSLGEFIASAITFFLWFYRAHKNLYRARVPFLKYASGWTIGGFFVPFLNLVRPFSMMKEIWRGSVIMSSIRNTVEMEYLETSKKIGWWWGFFLSSRFFSSLSRRFLRMAEEPGEFINPAWLELISSILTVVSGIILILLVKEITSHQMKARERSVPGVEIPDQISSDT